MQAIVGKRDLRGKVHYQVHWKGYSKEHDSWEPEENLVSCDELIKEYERKLDTGYVSYAHYYHGVTDISPQKSTDASEYPEGPRINEALSSSDEVGIQTATKPKRGRPPKHLMDSKIKHKSPPGTTEATKTPLPVKEKEVNRYNLRSTSKPDIKSVEQLGDDNNALPTYTSTSSSTANDLVKVPTGHGSYSNLNEPEAHISEYSHIQARLELQFGSKEEPQTQPTSSSPVEARKTDKSSILQVPPSESAPAPTMSDGHGSIRRKNEPSHIGSAEYSFAVFILLVGILGYVFTTFASEK